MYKLGIFFSKQEKQNEEQDQNTMERWIFIVMFLKSSMQPKQILRNWDLTFFVFDIQKPKHQTAF